VDAPVRTTADLRTGPPPTPTPCALPPACVGIPHIPAKVSPTCMPPQPRVEHPAAQSNRKLARAPSGALHVSDGARMRSHSPRGRRLRWGVTLSNANAAVVVLRDMADATRPLRSGRKAAAAASRPPVCARAPRATTTCLTPAAVHVARARGCACAVDEHPQLRTTVPIVVVRTLLVYGTGRKVCEATST
jgi:hypothetical protein